MSKNTCIDVYGERLKIGDEVIPVMDEAAIIGIEGIISEITYSEKYNNYYITIVDENGKELLKNVDARCYTTKERFNERENRDYVYSLVFHNNRCWPLTSLPLTNSTDPDYEIPEDTYFITLNSEHLKHIGTRKKVVNEKTNTVIIEDACDTYTTSYEYFFALKDKVVFYDNEKKKEYYLEIPETGKYMWTSNLHKSFKTKEELKNYIKELIRYFNNIDLSHVNNKRAFSRNTEGKIFEKTLIYKLSQNNPLID